MPDFTSCLSGSRERFRDRFREKAVGGTPWRKYSHHLYFRTGIGNQNRIDGIWTRIECDPFSERELLIGYLPERDRGSHRVSSGICQTIKRINNNQVINDTYKKVVDKLDYKHLSTTLYISITLTNYMTGVSKRKVNDWLSFKSFTASPA